MGDFGKSSATLAQAALPLSRSPSAAKAVEKATRDQKENERKKIKNKREINIYFNQFIKNLNQTYKIQNFGSFLQKRKTREFFIQKDLK